MSPKSKAPSITALVATALPCTRLKNLVNCTMLIPRASLLLTGFSLDVPRRLTSHHGTLWLQLCLVLGLKNLVNCMMLIPRASLLLTGFFP